MRRTYLNIGTVVMLTSLAAYGQSATGQTAATPAANAQSASVQTSNGQASSGQTSTGQASTGQASTGQSLGDVARQMKEKQTSTATAAPSKVITNQDLGESPEGRPDLREAPRAGLDRGYGQQPGQPRIGDQRAAQLRSMILEQETRVANLQARVDQINASMRSGAQFDGPYSRDQALQRDRAEQMKTRLDEQKRKLEAMQEVARRTGLHTQISDP